MREILFRGKQEDGEWVYGWFCPKDLEPSTFAVIDTPNIIREKDLLWCEVVPETVGQYTGLTDKNGTKIFEGDIVRATQNRIHDECYVGYENGTFMLYPKNGKIYERTLWEYWYNDWEVEVIGNIHDNPEKEKGQV